MQYRDQNLLFGIFAVQLNQITSSQLAAAGAAWATDQSSSLRARLIEAGVLSVQDADFVDEIVSRAIAKHGGNAEETLAQFGGDQQIHQSFAGAIAFTKSGGLQPTVASEDIVRFDNSDIPGVTEVPGRYTRESEHARGGMGRVLLVHDEHIGRDIALKELLPELRENSKTGTVDQHPAVRHSASLVTRFLQEARITGQLEHPAIVPVYELGQRGDGTIYYTMKLVRGRTLSQAISNAGTLRERLKLLPHFLDLCQAIAYAHSRHIIHRDLKPANVMIGEFGETVVLDWGLAKAKEKEDVHANCLAETLRDMFLDDAYELPKTAYGHAIGTPAYMPPEQAKGHLEQIDERSDVYSLGAVLYEILSGKPPHTGKTRRQVLNAVIQDIPSPIDDMESDVPAELISICSRALHKEPERRYQTTKDFATDIEHFQSGALVAAYDYTFRDLLKRYLTKHRPLVIAYSISIAVVLMLTVVFIESLAASRDVAVKERKRAERSLYTSNIRLASSHLERGNREGIIAALNSTPIEFRNWEWGYLDYYAHQDDNVTTLDSNSHFVAHAAFSPDGRRVVTASSDGIARIWDPVTGKQVRTLQGHESALYCAVFSPDGRWVATASWDRTAKLWDSNTGAELRTFTGHEDRVYSVAFDSSGSHLVTASRDKTSRIWETATGRNTLSLLGHDGGLMSAEFSPDDKLIVTASLDGTARVWDAVSGDQLLIYDSHPDGLDPEEFLPDGLNSAKFSPDGSRVITASNDDTARVWDPRSGAEIQQFEGRSHQNNLNSAAFSPDGRRVVTASDDNSAKIWDVESGEELLTLTGHAPASNLNSARFSPDGLSIVTASADGTAKIWRAVPWNEAQSR